jgi:hypothetical protein
MLRVVTAAALATLCASLTEIGDHSFRPPFQSPNHDGSRGVEGWSLGGTAEARKHFVRLTPDRQAKLGKGSLRRIEVGVPPRPFPQAHSQATCGTGHPFR